MAKSKTTSKTQAEEFTSACKLRVYLNSQQHQQLGSYLYFVQKFRNEAVAFCEKRRNARGIYLYQNKIKDPEPGELPPEINGHDIVAASKWLTLRLEQARLDVKSIWNIQAPKKQLRAQVQHVWANLSLGEKAELPDAWLLTLPRTVLDQSLQDMTKTYNKAIKDRSYNKKNPKKKIKAAGFPQFKKHSYPYSVRFQISTQQNKSYVDFWNSSYDLKKRSIYIPSLGIISFRDQQDLPAPPPEMITLSRNAAGQFHISFSNRDLKSSARNSFQTNRSSKLPTEHVYDPNLNKMVSVPTIRGVDLGLKTLGTYSKKLTEDQNKVIKKEAKRQRFFKKYETRLRFANKSCSRKVYRSKRWMKAKLKLGQVHTKTTNSRQDYLKKEAQTLVRNTAIICLEDLSLKFMLQNKKLSKAASDAALGAFKQYIRWESMKHGHLVIECGKFDASSKTCHQCKYYYKELTLKERSWTCPGCKTLHDRDENAAINIRQMALLKTIQGLEGGKMILFPSWSKTHGLSASGNDAPKVLSPYPLKKELTAFIERGGLTALLSLDCARESQPDEAFILPQISDQACKERT